VRPIAPRLPQRLLDVVDRLAQRPAPIAQINRDVGAAAARMGLPRPSYERVRRLVHEARALRAGPPTTAAVARDALLGARLLIDLRDQLGK
jgi:hypothetical protein